MAPAPKARQVSREAVPGAPAWFDGFLLILNGFMASVTDALARRLTRKDNLLSAEREGIAFRTPASGQEAVPVKWEVVPRPRHVQVSKLERTDDAAITAAWSYTWKLNQKGEILLTFQGLSASTDYTASILYE